MPMSEVETFSFGYSEVQAALKDQDDKMNAG